MTVLGPGSDGFHEEHIHVDLAERHNGYRICHWEIDASRPRSPASRLPRPRPFTLRPAEGFDAAASDRSQSASSHSAPDCPGSKPMPPQQSRRSATSRRLLHPYTNLDAVARDRAAGDRARQGRLTSTTATARPISKAWPGCGARRSATATRSWSRPRRRRCASCSFAHLFSGKSHDPAIELAEKLKEIAPVPISKVFFCNSGSEANDTQIKLVWYMNNALGRPKKKKIIGRIKAYHGVTIAPASLTGLAAQPQRFRPADRRHPAHAAARITIASRRTARARRISRRGSRPSSRRLIQREGPDTVAAFIAEPVMGAGGVIVPPKTLFREDQGGAARSTTSADRRRGDLRLRPTRHDVRLRDARLPADSISVAKALSSAYLPIAAVMVPGDDVSGAARREPQDRQLRPWLHLFAAIRWRRRWRSRRWRSTSATDRRRRSRRGMPQFQQRLKALGEHPLVGEARGLGLIGATRARRRQDEQAPLRCRSRASARAACAFAEEEGLIVRAVIGDTHRALPAAGHQPSRDRRVVRPLTRALDRTLDWAKRERLLAS